MVDFSLDPDIVEVSCGKCLKSVDWEMREREQQGSIRQVSVVGGMEGVAIIVVSVRKRLTRGFDAVGIVITDLVMYLSAMLFCLD